MRGRAAAFPRGVAEKSAGARIHRRNEQKIRRKAQRHVGARDGDRAVFERLAQNLQHIARKFGQLIEK